MFDFLPQILEIARGMWRLRWIGLAVAWICAIAGAVAVYRVPQRYEAASRIYVDTQSVLKPLLSGLAVQPDVNQQVSMLARNLITRPNLEKLIRDADLGILARTDRERDELIDMLSREIKLASGSRENLFNVSYRDTDMKRAQRVVQSLTTMFVDSGLGEKRRDSEQARRFIDEQIKSYEKKLEESENRLKEFKLQNLGFATGPGKDFFGQISNINEELAKVKLDLSAARQSRDALKRELAGEDPVLLPEPGTTPTASSGLTTPEIDARLDVLRKQLDEQLRRFTEEHPDVVGTRRLIASLEEQRRQELDTRRKNAPTASRPITAANNPVYQRLKVAYAEAEANVASLSGRAAELESRLGKLRSAAGKVPQVEAEMAQLNRDYDVLRRQYDTFVARRESAAVSEDVDASTQLAEFRIIDPPRVSPKPVFPNRAVLAPLALVLSLIAGTFATFAMTQLFPTIDSARVLRELGQRPVLGTVSIQLNPAAESRRRASNFAFGGAFAALLLVAGAWITWVGLLSS